MKQTKIPATYMRGGTSKGVFFLRDFLPADPVKRDQVLLRVLGSPDPYGKQIDGLGGATSSTSKAVIVAKSTQPGCDIDYLFGAVSIDSPVVDWSGNCGNLLAAVAPFALSEGLVTGPRDGMAVVRIWQVNTRKIIVAHVPLRGGEVVETGTFMLDGVPFPSAEIVLEYLDPGSDAAEGKSTLFPTGLVRETMEVPGVGQVDATLVNAGNPLVLVDPSALGARGDELPAVFNADPELLRRCEAIRAEAAVRMGLAVSAAEATARRPATPKLVLVADARGYVASSGVAIAAGAMDLCVRVLSMGQLHHAIPGTAAVGITVAAQIPGTVVHRRLGEAREGRPLRLGHPSGTMTTTATAERRGSEWVVSKVVMSRSARRLMAGWVFVPEA